MEQITGRRVEMPPPFFPLSLAVDPHTPQEFMLLTSSGAAGIFRSIDAGATWQSVRVAQTDAEGGYVGVSPLTPGLVYANSGRLTTRISAYLRVSMVAITGHSAPLRPSNRKNRF